MCSWRLEGYAAAVGIQDISGAEGERLFSYPAIVVGGCVTFSALHGDSK